MSAPTTNRTVPTERVTARRPLIAALVAMAALVSCGGGESTTGSGDEGSTATTVAVATTVAHEPTTHDFVVPAGTSVLVERGVDPGIIPKRIDVRVGDRIRVRNDDTEVVRLGLFNVAPGETVTMDFNKVGVMSGVIFDEEGGGCGSPPPADKVFIVNVKP